MKKTLLFISIMIVAFGCEQQTAPAIKTSPVDSIDRQIRAEKMAHDLIDKAKNDANNSLYNKSKATSPVLIKKCTITTDEYGAKSINITVKNNSKKKIDGLKVSWTLYNNFNERIDDGNGIAQEHLAANKWATYTWNIYTPVTHAKAYVFSIHYTDGTTWSLPLNYQ